MKRVTAQHRTFNLFPRMINGSLLATSYYWERTLCINATVNCSPASLPTTAVAAYFCVAWSIQILSIYLYRSLIYALSSALPLSLHLSSSFLPLYQSCFFYLTLFLWSTFLAPSLFVLSRSTSLAIFLSFLLSCSIIPDPSVPLVLLRPICLESSVLLLSPASSLFSFSFPFSLFCLPSFSIPSSGR